MTDPPPLTGGAIDAWTLGLAPDDVGPAVVALGTTRSQLSRWPARDHRDPVFLTWTAPDATPAVGSQRTLLRSARPGVEWLREPIDPELSYRRDEAEGRARPPLRLALEGNTIPTEVVPRLLACPGVASVVVPTPRAPGALKRRAWQWPMRLGVVDDALLDELRSRRGAHLIPDALAEVVDMRTDPRPVGILALASTPSAAVALLSARPQVANAVLCIAPAEPESWAVTDARLAMLRALTGAVVTGVIAPRQTPLAEDLLRILRYIGHGYTFDVAVTAAVDRNVLIVGELEPLNESHLPQVFRARAAQYRRDIRTGGARADAQSRVDTLELASGGRFDHEQHEATTGAIESRTVEEALDADTTPRVVQAMVARPGRRRGGVPDNVIRPGPNVVEVFVGPQDPAALQGSPVTNRELGFVDASITSVRLTAVLVPLVPVGDPVRSELEVPRIGRSTAALLPWRVPGGSTAAQARIVLLHRNRVIQTAVLTGTVGGPPATLAERIVLWPDLAHLDDRSPFDRAFVMNHDDGDDSLCASFAGDQHVAIKSIDEINSVAGHIRGLLVEAAGMKQGNQEDLRRHIAELAVHGRVLHKALRSALGEIGTPRRIQIVSARPTWMLPLEFVYDRPASRDAVLCPHWLAQEPCGAHCFADEDDATVVCPSVFWGLGRVIERHYVDMTSHVADTFWVGATPTVARSSFVPTRAAFAASRKVRATDVKAVAKALGDGVTALGGWDDWKQSLRREPTDLLVLMPHSDPRAVTLEVAGTTLAKGEIEKWHVTGGQDVTPLVILFGCDTAGFEDDPAGYATAFVQEHACVVFSTFTMILGSHASRMSQRLISTLMDPARTRVPLGEVLATLRGELAREGLLAGLSITAYGDSAWKV